MLQESFGMRAYCPLVFGMDCMVGTAHPTIKKEIYRGVAKSDLGDKKGALQDYTTAIQLDPSAVKYYNRASTRDDLGEKKGTIADYQEAARLYKKEGNTKKYSEILETVRVIKSFLPK